MKMTQLIDLERYPLHDPNSSQRTAATDQARAQLRTEGCAVIRDLVPPDALACLQDEVAANKHATHYSRQKINPYFHTERDAHYPDRHPVNTFMERSSGFIPGDSWAVDGPMTELFNSPELMRFIADCLDVPELHCYADPLAGLTANVLEAGQEFSWHFDTNDFAITLLIDEPDEGGLFQYVPGIRSAEHEGFDAIQGVVEGGSLIDGRLGVRTLELRPGDLQIFRGRHSLHRVTRVGADSAPRHAAIFAYTEESGVIGRAARTRQLFGRVLPEHTEGETEHVRSDTLLD